MVADTRRRRDENGLLGKVLFSRLSRGLNFASGLSGSEGAGVSSTKRRFLRSILLSLAAGEPSEGEDAPLDHGLLGFALGFSGSGGGGDQGTQALGGFSSALPSMREAFSVREDEEARRVV